MNRHSNSIFLVLCLIIGLGFLLMSINLTQLEDKVAPILFSVILMILVLVELARELAAKGTLKVATGPVEKGPEDKGSVMAPRIVAIALWLGGPILGICLLGFHITIPLFILLFLTLHGTGWLKGVITALVTEAFFMIICEYGLRIHFYKGLILELWQ
ncbi:hypothetical protein ACFL0H_12625 [Thermodesulfobacteriota bacterium]